MRRGVAGPTATHTLRVTDDEAPPALSINDVSADEAAGTLTFTVTASRDTSMEVAVAYATSNGTAQAPPDYTTTNGTLAFTPGSPRTRTVTVPLVDDSWSEPSETFALTLSAPSHATMADGTGVGTTVDNDGPREEINLGLGGSFFADVGAGPNADDYLLLVNPHASPVTVRLTAIRPNGSALKRDVVVGAGARLTLPLRTDPVFANQGLISLAAQSLTPALPIDADHAQYWGANWEGGRATEGVAPAPVWYLAEGAVGYFDETITVFNPLPVPVEATFEVFTSAGAVHTRTDRVPSGPGRFRLAVRDWLGVVDHGTRV